MFHIEDYVMFHIRGLRYVPYRELGYVPYKCPPVEKRREGIIVKSDRGTLRPIGELFHSTPVGKAVRTSEEDWGRGLLLLVVYGNAFEPLALWIDSSRSDGAAFAIGRRDNPPCDGDLSVFLDG